MEDKKITIYSYTKVWKIEKKMYRLVNIPLPVPVNPFDLLYFVIVFVFMVILGKLVPFIAAIPVVIRCIAIPYFITGVLMKKKLDGKNPIKFFAGCMIYYLTEKAFFTQLFKRYPKKEKAVTLHWKCSMGRRDNHV